MALFKRSTKKKGPGVSPVVAGAIAAILIAVGTFFGFSRLNPFHHPYEFTATFQSANNLTTKSPVRIAGVEVGAVTKVEPIPGGNGAARVTMQIEDVGLPIHKDAVLKIRQRIFLEGNFFVDLQPGTAGSGNLEDGGRIPVNQTETPVQFGQILTALQSDTRKDLKQFLVEYAQNGLGNGASQGEAPVTGGKKTGAEYYNESLDDAPDALQEHLARQRRHARRAPGRPPAGYPFAAGGLQGTLDPPREPQGPRDQPERHRARSVERRGGASGDRARSARHGGSRSSGARRA